MWPDFPGFREQAIQTGPEGCLGLGCAKGNRVSLRRKSAPKDVGRLQDTQALSLGELSGDEALETSTIHCGGLQSFRDPGKSFAEVGLWDAVGLEGRALRPQQEAAACKAGRNCRQRGWKCQSHWAIGAPRGCHRVWPGVGGPGKRSGEAVGCSSLLSPLVNIPVKVPGTFHRVCVPISQGSLISITQVTILPNFILSLFQQNKHQSGEGAAGRPGPLRGPCSCESAAPAWSRAPSTPQTATPRPLLARTMDVSLREQKEKPSSLPTGQHADADGFPTRWLGALGAAPGFLAGPP